jgi:hypothetical protein
VFDRRLLALPYWAAAAHIGDLEQGCADAVLLDEMSSDVANAPSRVENSKPRR